MQVEFEKTRKESEGGGLRACRGDLEKDQAKNMKVLECQDDEIPYKGDGDLLQITDQGSPMIQGKRLRM